MVGIGDAGIRGIDIVKTLRGFADEQLVFKRFVINATTKNKEIRYYTKTAGYLDSTDTTGMTASRVANQGTKTIPEVVGAAFTRNTAYTRVYKAETEWISEEEITDNDVNLLQVHLTDLATAVANQIDARIYDVITESQSAVNILSTDAIGTGWDDTTNGNPVKDILQGKQKIRAQRYNPEGGVVAMNPIEYMHLMNYLLVVKGSNWVEFSSDKLEQGVVMKLLGMNILVSQNAVTDSVAMWIPDQSATYYEFSPLTAETIRDPGIGRKIRAWASGEAVLHDPKSVHLTTDTIT